MRNSVQGLRSDLSRLHVRDVYIASLGLSSALEQHTSNEGGAYTL